MPQPSATTAPATPAASLDAEERELAARLLPWANRADELIGRRIADAKAHAAAGRLGEAGDRLAELRVALAGPRMADGVGVLADARAQFLRQSFAAIRPSLDPAIHRTDLAPSAELERTARTAPVGRADRDHSAEALALADDAARDLAAAAAGSPGSLDAWESSQRERFGLWTRRHLSDAQIALREAVARLHVRPELR